VAPDIRSIAKQYAIILLIGVDTVPDQAARWMPRSHQNGSLFLFRVVIDRWNIDLKPDGRRCRGCGEDHFSLSLSLDRSNCAICVLLVSSALFEKGCRQRPLDVRDVAIDL
jgi:hypothetical protein